MVMHPSMDSVACTIGTVHMTGHHRCLGSACIHGLIVRSAVCTILLTWEVLIYAYDDCTLLKFLPAKVGGASIHVQLVHLLKTMNSMCLHASREVLSFLAGTV